MTAVTHSSDMACDAPRSEAMAGIPIDGRIADVSVTPNGYVYRVKLWGQWYFAHEVLSAQMLNALQQAYEEME